MTAVAGRAAGRARLAQHPRTRRPTPRSCRSRVGSEDDAEDLDGREVRVSRHSAAIRWRASCSRSAPRPGRRAAMTDAARTLLPDGALHAGPGSRRITLVPSVIRAKPYGAGPLQRVRRGPRPQGDGHAQRAPASIVASASPIEERIAQAAVADDDQPQASSLYASLHYTAAAAGHPAGDDPADPARSTPTRPISASGCARATASSSSST